MQKSTLANLNGACSLTYRQLQAFIQYGLLMLMHALNTR